MMKVDFLKPLLIESVVFRGVFLRMDGSGVTSAKSAGGGKVNCQTGIETSGLLKVQQLKDGTFTFESVKYPGVFLRMDGSGIHSFTGVGGGHVNCQFGAGMWERFKLDELYDGSYTIESVAFPNIFLRMIAANPDHKKEDFGIINCQYGASSCEKFYLSNFPETRNMKDWLGKFNK